LIILDDGTQDKKALKKSKLALSPEEYEYAWRLQMDDLKKLNTQVFYVHFTVGVAALVLS
jgi:hypothetical protein